MESDSDAPIEAIAGVGDPDALPIKNTRKRSCVVCGPTSGKVLKIPKNEPMRGKWLQALRLQSGDVKESSRVCESHVEVVRTGDAAVDVQAMVVEDVEASAVAEDVDVEQEGGHDLPPKKAWQLKAQVEALEKKLSEKEDENSRLKEQNGILSQLNDRKNIEIERLRGKVKNLQSMLGRTRKAMQKGLGGNSKE